MLVCALGVVSMGVSACSFTLEWEKEGLPCTRDERCADGFSCLGDACIRNQSLSRGDTCSQSDQCAESLICTADPYVCKDTCPSSSFYRFTSDCTSGHYCRPTLLSGGGFIGSCNPSECGSDTDCDPAFVCVGIHATASACLVGCEIEWQLDSQTQLATVYSDNCASSVGE